MGGLLSVLLVNSVATVAADSDLIVQLDIDLPAQDADLADPSSFPVRVEPGETVELTVRVFGSGDPDTPMAVEDSSDLLEIRDSTGASPPLRFADMNEVSPGVYTINHTFGDEGEFLVVVQPGVEDRTTLHPDSIDQVRFIVGGDIPPSPQSESGTVDTVGTVTLLLLVLLVGGLVLMATRKRPGRRYAKKAPGRADVDRDSWWWSG